MTTHPAPSAHVDGLLATDLVQVADLRADPRCWTGRLVGGGGTFEGAMTGYRFGRVGARRPARADRPWRGRRPAHWRSSWTGRAYLAGRAPDPAVHRGRRRLSGQPLPVAVRAARRRSDPLALAQLLAAGNPAPYQGVLDLGDRWIVTASPELFLSRDGDRLASSPIKGTTRPARTLRGQGLSGEHHDHRPGPQRPGPDRPARAR